MENSDDIEANHCNSAVCEYITSIQDFIQSSKNSSDLSQVNNGCRKFKHEFANLKIANTFLDCSQPIFDRIIKYFDKSNDYFDKETINKLKEITFKNKKKLVDLIQNFKKFGINNSNQEIIKSTDLNWIGPVGGIVFLVSTALINIYLDANLFPLCLITFCAYYYGSKNNDKTIRVKVKEGSGCENFQSLPCTIKYCEYIYNCLENILNEIESNPNKVEILIERCQDFKSYNLKIINSIKEAENLQKEMLKLNSH